MNAGNRSSDDYVRTGKLIELDAGHVTGLCLRRPISL